jgi:hypothetical protein
MRFFARWICLSTFILLICPFIQAEHDPLKNIARELAGDLSRLKKIHIAVLEFPHHDNRLSHGPFLVSERLTTFLAQDKRLRLVERNHLNQVLGELHLSQSGLIDKESAQKMGQILGVDVIVTGTLIDLPGGLTEVNARSIRTDTGQVVAASRIQIERFWQGKPRLNRFVEGKKSR